MNQPEAIPPVNLDAQPSSPSPPQQPVVRWRLQVLAMGMLTLAVGYYAGQFLRQMSRGSAAPNPPNGAELETDTPADASSPVLATVNPDSPPPETAEALTQEMLAAMEELTSMFPESADAWEVRARAELWRGNSTQALAMWEQCLQRDPKYVYAFVGQASVAAERAEHERAAELAEQALQLEPRNFQARAILADALLQLGRAADVPAVLDVFLQTDPRSQGHFLLGQAFGQLEQYEKARDQYESAIRIFPDYVEAYNGLARAYERLGEADKAKQAMDTFRRLGSPEKAAARIRGATLSDLELLYRGAAVLYTDAGRLFYTRGHAAEAETLWLRAAALDANNVPCRQSLAWLTRNASRPGETIAWLKQLAAIEPQNPSYWLEVGRVYEDLALLPAAEEAFVRAAEAAPESDAGHAAVADLLVRYQQNLPEALQRARRAVEINPSAANYAVLSAASRLNRDRTAALEAIEQAVKLAPQDARYRAIRDVVRAEE